MVYQNSVLFSFCLFVTLAQGHEYGFPQKLRCARWLCPAVVDPVCGSDGVTYSNFCYLLTSTCGRGVTMAHKGSCCKAKPPSTELLCSAVYDPVCGTDGKTYSNQCQLNVANCGRTPKIDLASEGPCVKIEPPRDCDQLVCLAVYDPVCGTDGKTYSNSCNMDIANCRNKNKVQVDYKGECGSPAELTS